ncbi:hypothetical protein ParKJ_34460 [Paraburkholderia fungorum]|jgi:hypothetical protein|uniref:Shufflon system plasmid conjugative transfer pilus tip adhesin PilV n=1 Tax=Paraburkholderia fungorum TaxID=134537 RepID=A0AAP5QH95_9BURK|nr:hypothetical protein [Paraburkholderia fungorum]MDT8842540.1 hypothetical protein [Paraburkholderia fungorum]
MGSILEMMIVLLGAAVLTMQGIKEDVAHQRTVLLQNEGQHQASINAALSDYITNNVGLLIPPGFSQTSSTALAAPTLAQLSAQSNTKVTYKTGPFWGGVYQISLSVVPASCSASAGDCHIASLLYPSQPLMLGGKPDVAGAGAVAYAGGNQFGYSTNKAPGTITGLNAKWSTPNPNGNVPASIVAINGFGNDANSPYYRRDGALPLTGALAGGGQDANNLKNINATGNVAAATVSLQAGNSLNISTGATYYGDTTNAAVRTNGSLYLQNKAGTAAANIAQVGNVNSSGTITAPTVNFNTTAGTCSWNTVTLRANNQMWVCNQWGNWVPISQLIGNVMTVAKYVNQTDTAGIGKPSCTSGTPTATIVPQNIGLNVAANPPWESSIYRLNDMGTWWSVQISLQDANGTWYSGNTMGLAAEVQTQCTYSNE